MNALLASRDVSVAILTKWVSLKDLHELDNAACSTAHRPQLLQLMQDEQFQFSCKQEVTDSSFLQWMWMRRIGMDHIHITIVHEGWDFANLQSYLELRGSQITSFALPEYETYAFDSAFQIDPTARRSVPLSPTQFSTVFRLIPNIVSVDNVLTEALTVPFLRDFRSRCPKLTRIKYTGPWSAASLKAFWDCGYQGIAHLAIPSYDKFEQGLVLTVQNNTALRSLEVTNMRYNSLGTTDFSNAVFAAIAAHCPDI